MAIIVRPPSRVNKANGCSSKGRSKPGKGKGRPASSDRIYDADEEEFIRATARWQADRGIKFPCLSDYLAILKSLGYSRPAPKGLVEGFKVVS